MQTRMAKPGALVADSVDQALLVATCLWDDQCYGPCPHHSATPEEVAEARDWLESHRPEVRAWAEERTSGGSPLGLLVQGHVGDADGPFWECEGCGFRFDLVHADPGGSRSCPNCEAMLLRQLLSAVTNAVLDDDHPVSNAAIAQERLRMWDTAREGPHRRHA